MPSSFNDADFYTYFYISRLANLSNLLVVRVHDNDITLKTCVLLNLEYSLMKCRINPGMSLKNCGVSVGLNMKTKSLKREIIRFQGLVLHLMRDY
mmetsp:Transcript_8106/g.14680  ORF Transcript_8106/g.14680 Transcript_8106/m.14680 type:complete len:95 (+) Transcript_8106:407-691(+)